MNRNGFDVWLKAYGAAWETGDVQRAVTLFTAEAEYFETPFEPPMVGSDAIAAYWTAGAAEGQRDVRFAHTILSVSERTGLAHWHATFTRIASGSAVTLDGILQAEFADGDRCARFREWWHRTEH